MHLRSTLLSGLFLLLLSACSQAPEPRSHYSQAQPLEGIESAWSVRLDRVGDVRILGSDSAMKDALLAAGDSVYVAATSFEVDGVFGVDMIIVNHSDRELVLDREDVHLLDAEGRWLDPVASAPAAAAAGMQGRPYSGADTERVYELPDRTDQLDRDLVLAETGVDDLSRPRKTPQRSRDRLPRRDEETPEAAVPEMEEDQPPVVTAVRIAPGEGKAFWAYFRADAPPMPLTALVVLEEQQLGFKFGR